MRTPSSALPAWPNGLLDGFGRPLPLLFLATSFTIFFDFAAAFLAVLRAGLPAFFFALAICFLLLHRYAREGGHPVITDGSVFTGSPLSRGRHLVDAYFFFSLLCGLRLPMRPDS